LQHSILNDPLHWQGRAEEARAMAEEIRDPGAKATMLRVAQDYDDMASRAEARCKAQRGGSSVVPFPASASRPS
jgi:hypothetical protein